MQQIIEKGYGKIMVNFLRQLLLTKVPTWRPIAFSLGNSANVVSAGENVLEDSVEISSKICKYHYDIDCDTDFYKYSVTTSQLNIDDINNGTIKVFDADGGSIFHALNQEVTITIYFRKDKGMVLLNQNQANLSREGISPDNVVIMNSRHTNIIAVRVDSYEKDELSEEISVEVDSYSDESEEELMQIICSDMVEKFKELTL